VVALAADTGAATDDGHTSDPRIAVAGVPGAARYEYRVGGTGTFIALPGPGDFSPSGLADGSVAVEVRAVGADGRPGREAILRFTLDRAAPAAPAPRLLAGSDTGRSATDGITNTTAPRFEAGSEPGDVVVLLRGGVEVARGSGGTLTDPGPVPDGRQLYTLRRIDRAGNASTSPAVAVEVDTTPPGAVPGLLATRDGLITHRLEDPTLWLQYRVEGGAFVDTESTVVIRPRPLRVGDNRVDVRAVDPAGNTGAITTVIVPFQPSRLEASLVDPAGRDIAGRSGRLGPDGRTDTRIQLAGLPASRRLSTVEVVSSSGERWNSTGTGGAFRLAVLQRPGGVADLYLQEAAPLPATPRTFEIRLTFADRSTETLVLPA
jgi:hypothetical protein